MIRRAKIVGQRCIVRQLPIRRTHTQSYEELKADFAHWARKEAALIGLFLATGLGVVAAYAYRDDAPVKQMVYCINQAKAAAEKGNKTEARQLTQRAYAIAKSVSPRERHLHELAFSIAAQYDAAEQYNLAKKYYFEAIDHIPYMKHAIEKGELHRMITLDRIAQCCHNVSDAENAVRFYEQALAIHVQHKSESCTEIDLEGCGIWYNYGRLCQDMGNPVKARSLLEAAQKIGVKCRIPQDKLALIEENLAHED
ncbi:unnamed protein product [Aphanomyces euteiches]|uniref:MalT-like TPR region domain-containing protein n=1 Tax=Aphanomyces euteiches TaxID=100861 RepID=A0A6G0XKV3_9STRA|nr:hypothetical protein Ae201684_003620 [Aphanomyces euteiches]